MKIQTYPNNQRYACSFEPSTEGHRYFLTYKGTYHIADQSGYWPEDTDDGVLILDTDGPAIEHHVSASISVRKPNGERYRVTIAKKDAEWLRTQFPDLLGPPPSEEVSR